MKTVNTLRAARLGVAAAAVAGLIGLTGGTAMAATYTGSVTHGTAATFHYEHHTTVIEYITGYVKDTKADGLCARAYASGGSGWDYLGQACGNGTVTYLGNDRPFRSTTRVSVCAGIPNSSRSNCTNKSIP